MLATDGKKVVMGFVDGLTLEEFCRRTWESAVVDAVKNRLTDAVSHLHNGEFVFGDLRPPNVILTHNDSVVLVDFDMAEKDGIAKYPTFLNSQLGWPAGASSNQLITADHDREWLARLITRLDSCKDDKQGKRSRV